MSIIMKKKQMKTVGEWEQIEFQREDKTEKVQDFFIDTWYLLHFF